MRRGSREDKHTTREVGRSGKTHVGPPPCTQRLRKALDERGPASCGAYLGAVQIDSAGRTQSEVCTTAIRKG